MKLNPLDILPNEKSTSDQWIAFWNALVKVYGKVSAQEAFVQRWARRGTNGIADVVEVQTGTGLTLSKDLIQSVESMGHNAVSYIGGFFETMATGTKVIFYVSIGIGVILVGGIVIRVITLSAEDAGVVAGTAAKAFA